MNADELYNEYAKWSGLLHFWAVKHLQTQLNAEFFPAPAWEMEVFPGELYQDLGATVPLFIHKPGIRIKLPRPEHSPTEQELEETFRRLCLAAARVLGMDTAKAVLPASKQPESAIITSAPERDHTKNRKSDVKSRSGFLRLHGSRRPSKARRQSAPTGKDREHGKKRAG